MLHVNFIEACSQMGSIGRVMHRVLIVCGLRVMWTLALQMSTSPSSLGFQSACCTSAQCPVRFLVCCSNMPLLFASCRVPFCHSMCMHIFWMEWGQRLTWHVRYGPVARCCLLIFGNIWINRVGIHVLAFRVCLSGVVPQLCLVVFQVNTCAL